jgi:hypothetical protein
MKDIIKDLYKELLNVKWYELPVMIIILVFSTPVILIMLLVVLFTMNDSLDNEMEEEINRMIEEIASYKK